MTVEVRSVQTPAHRRRTRGLRWAVAASTGLLVLSVVSGAVYQWAASTRDLRRLPPPGELIDVGGFRLHLVCRGAGVPTVVMDAGLGDSWLTWASIQPAAARTTHVCAYDRAGLGYSDPGPEPRDSRQIVGELHTLLTRAHLPGPYVLVGHSMGGMDIRLFAYTYPDEVAALVLVDPAHEDQYRLFPPSVQSTFNRLGEELCFQARLARFGIQRLRGLTAADTMASAPDQRWMAATLGFRTAWYRAVCDEFAEFTSGSGDEVRAARRMLAVPLYVLDGNAHMAGELQALGIPAADADSAETVWHALHRALASASPEGHLIVAARSSHYVQFDQPTMVLDAIADAVTAARLRRAP